MKISKRGKGLAGISSVTEHLGAGSFCPVETQGGERLIVRGRLRDGPREGDTVKLTLNPQDIHLFDDAGPYLTSLAK